MLAIEIINHQLQSTDRPVPQPCDTEVLIQVKAAGINRPDIMQREGLYPPPTGASDIPGLELSGIVYRVGDSVSHIKEGDRVCALVTGGAYAEYCVADATLCLPVPHGLDFIQAAGIPETFFTVWSNIFDRAQLETGETILIHGGTSGIGTTAIQFAKSIGAKVIITAGSDKKCDFCKQLGADASINYKTQDFVTEVARLTQDKGVDVILDIIGGDYLYRNINCMGYDGRLVQIAVQNGVKTEINLLPIMLKRLTLTGSTLRARCNTFKSEIAKQLLKQIWPLLESDNIKPIIDCTFPLEKVDRAHKLMESSKHIGKIVLIP